MNPEEREELIAVIDRHPRRAGWLSGVMLECQEKWGWLSPEVLSEISDRCCVPLAQIYEVATFYTRYRLKPAGKHTIYQCHGTACHVRNAKGLQREIERHLKIPEGQDTDPDREYTLEKTGCLGCCSLAPAVQVGDKMYGPVRADEIPAMLDDFHATRRQTGAREPEDGTAHPGRVRICVDSCCLARDSGEVRDIAQRVARELGLEASIQPMPCVLLCDSTPQIEITGHDGRTAIYTRVRPSDVRELMLEHFPAQGMNKVKAFGNRMLYPFLYSGQTPPPPARHTAREYSDGNAGFFGHQKRVATEPMGGGDPLNLDDWVQSGGFSALGEVKRIGADAFLRELDASGLRGRGGAGFPTAIKWRAAREAKGGDKVVLINGDEGDPGAFMDRMLLESFPFRVLEGALIAAHIIGAGEIIFYIRAEYPHALRRMREAIRRLCDSQLFDFQPGMRVVEGAGAYICGEETAMLESLEGRAGRPRQKPPYPAEYGLEGRPTLVNNVETLCMIPWIAKNGGEEYAKLGTKDSPGTKVFALAGKVRRVGLIEVEMGTTIRTLVEEIGGGVPEGKRFKAVLIGGPSGGMIPEWDRDLPVDFQTLSKTGAILGSGGLVVLDEDDCAVDIAAYFLRFSRDESCGQCSACRLGTRQAAKILDNLCRGKGHKRDLDELESLVEHMTSSSICGLGKMAANPLATAMRHFRDEFEAHLNGFCPAKSCSDLIQYHINDRCVACTLCAQACPVDAIPFAPREKHSIDTELCTRCGACLEACPVDAVERRS